MKINKNDVEELLNNLITRALGMPGGDPDHVHNSIAAICYNAMKHWELDTSLHDIGTDGLDQNLSTSDQLGGDNYCKYNYLEDFDWKGNYTDIGRKK